MKEDGRCCNVTKCGRNASPRIMRTCLDIILWEWCLLSREAKGLNTSVVDRQQGKMYETGQPELDHFLIKRRDCAATAKGVKIMKCPICIRANFSEWSLIKWQPKMTKILRKKLPITNKIWAYKVTEQRAVAKEQHMEGWKLNFENFKNKRAKD